MLVNLLELLRSLWWKQEQPYSQWSYYACGSQGPHLLYDGIVWNEQATQDCLQFGHCVHEGLWSRDRRVTDHLISMLLQAGFDFVLAGILRITANFCLTRGFWSLS